MTMNTAENIFANPACNLVCCYTLEAKIAKSVNTYQSVIRIQTVRLQLGMHPKYAADVISRRDFLIFFTGGASVNCLFQSELSFLS